MTVVEFGFVLLALIDEKVHTIERHSPVVADDAAAAVRIGQTGNKVGVATLHDLGGIGIEDAVVVGLAILGEDLSDFGIGLDAVSFQTPFNHAPTAEGHDRALEWRISLQSDNDLGVAVDVTGFVRQNS